MNSTTLYSQFHPAVAALSGGKFMIAWTDYSGKQPDDYSTAIRARRFSASGQPLGADFVVNSITDFSQEFPEAAGLKNGGAIVIWDDNSGQKGDDSQYAVRGQRFSGAGGKQGGEFKLNKITLWTQYRQAVAATKGGGFVGIWEDHSGTNGGSAVSPDIRGQIFSASGGKVGPEFLANSITESAQLNPTVAGLSDGTVLTAWGDNSGKAKTEDPAYLTGMDVRAQLFNAQGKRIGKEFLVNQTKLGGQDFPSAAGLPGGEYVVVWEDLDTSYQSDIKARIMKGTGQNVRSQFTVNTFRTGDQEQPVVGSFPNGRFVVVWTDKNAAKGDFSGYAVRGQLFSGSGQKLGDHFLVNKTTPNNQQHPAVAILNNSTFVVTWTDDSQKRPDTDSSSIRAQMFRITK